MPVNKYTGPRLYNIPIKPAISGGTIVPSFADDKTRAAERERINRYVNIQKSIEEGARIRKEQQRRYEDSLRIQKEEAKRAYELKKQRREEDDAKIKAIRQKEAAELEKANEENEKLQDREYKDWIKKKGLEHAVSQDQPTEEGNVAAAGLNALLTGVFKLRNMIGLGLNGGTEAHMEGIKGKHSIAGTNITEAEAHLKSLDLQNSIDAATQQANLYKEIYAPKPGQTQAQFQQSQNELRKKLNDINTGISQLKAQLNDPTLKQLDEEYKLDQYLDTDTGLLDAAGGMLVDAVKGLTILDSKKQKLRDDLAAARKAQLIQNYNKKLLEKASVQEFDKTGEITTNINHGITPNQNNLKQAISDFKNNRPRTKSDMDIAQRQFTDNVDREQTKAFINAKKAERAQLEQDYADTAKFQENMAKMFKVTESYKKGEQLNQNAGLLDWNYWKYVMPGMIGSSNSSIDQIKANAVQGVATVAGVLLSPYTDGASLVLPNVATILTTPWQIKGGLEENYGEVGTKRGENLAKAISQYTKSDGSNDILNDLTQQSIDYWKKKGMSQEWIDQRYHSGTDNDTTNVMSDFIMGYTRNNDPRLKHAFYESQKGLKAQFWADNIRTMGELPTQIAMQLIPTGPLKRASNIGVAQFAERGFGKLANKVAKGEISKEVAERYIRRYGARMEQNGAKFVNGFNSVRNAASSGFEAGAEAADMLGFGYGGHIIGGVVGATAKPIFKLGANLLTPEMRASIADMGEAFMKKYQMVYDKLLPKDWMRLAARYGLNAANRGIRSAFSEGAEEGVQYLNSKEDFASKYGFSTPNIADLLANDWAQGSKVAKAYGYMLGLNNSELKDDEEYWQNVKGGFALGFAQPAVMNIAGSVPNAIRQYKTDKVLVESLIMNREADKMNRSANAAFAKESMKGRGQDLIDGMTHLYEQDKRRDGDNRKYTDEDYEDKLNAARGINGLVQSQRVKGMLEAKGFKFGTDEYATAIADIYNNQESLIENQKQSDEHNTKLQSLYNSKDFQNEVDQVLTRVQNDDISAQDAIKNAQKKAADKVELEIIKQAKASGEQIGSKSFKKKVYDAKKEAKEQAKQEWLSNARSNLIYQTKLANRLKALLKIKQQQETLEDIYKLTSRFNAKTKKPDAKAISNIIDKQIDGIKNQLKNIDDSINFGSTTDDAIKAADGISYLIGTHSDEIQQSDVALSMLQADRELTQNGLDLFQYGIIRTNDGKYQYNEAQYIKQQDHDKRLRKAMMRGNDELVKQIQSEDTSVAYTPGLEELDGYRKRVNKIMQASDRNAKLNWMVSDIYEGDAVSKYMESVQKEHEATAKEVNKREIKYKPKPNEDPLYRDENQTKESTSTAPITPNSNIESTSESKTKFEQTSDKREKAFSESNLKYQKNKKRAQQAYERRKKQYKNWKKGNLNASLIPFQDSIVAITNSLMKNAEIGVYKIQEFIDDVKEIADDIDIKDYIPQLKRAYIKNATKLQFQHPELINNVSSADEVVSYGIQVDPELVHPEKQPKNEVQTVLDKDAERIDEGVSSYHDVIVNTENGPVLCSNHEAIRKLKDDAKTIILQYKTAIEQVKDNDEQLLNLLQTLFAGTHVQYKSYLKYKNVDGIWDAIARNAVSVYPNESIVAGIRVRNAVIATFLGHEQSLNPMEYGSNFAGFIKQCQDLRDSLKSAGWNIITASQNIYDIRSKSCEQADIILTNDEGKIRIIDVLSSYADIRERWNYRPGGSAHFTIEEREKDILHSLQDILTTKLRRPVDYLGVLPVTFDMRYDILGIQEINGNIKFIDVAPKNNADLLKYNNLSDEEYNQQLYQKTQALWQFIHEYNEKATQYTELQNKIRRDFNKQVQPNYSPLQFAEPTTIQDCDDQIRRAINTLEDLEESYNEIQDIYNNLKSDKKRVERQEDETAYFEDYAKSVENISMQAIDRLGLLDDSCRELDQLADRFIGGRIVDADDKVLIKKLYKAVFDAQSALDDVLSDPETSDVDVTQEEELIASIMEKIVQNRSDLGAMGMFVQRWWITNLASINKENYGTYINKILSWTNTLRNHVLNDLDNHPALQAWYNSILNNYFTILLDNSEKFCNKLPDGVEKITLQNANQNGRDLIRDFNLGWGDKEDEEFPAPPKDEIERINRMPHMYKDKYNISKQHPLSWSAMQMNDNYWWMSKQPDFAEKAQFNLYVADKERTYRNPRYGSSYTIKPGDVVMFVKYVDKDGKDHWADIPLTIDKSYFPNASQEDIDRIDRINRAQKKFTKRLKRQLNYVSEHPECKLDVKISTNKGSIQYDRNGQYHGVTEFLFRGQGNEKDLYTIKTSKESRIGVSVFVNNNGKFTYDVYGGDNMHQRIGGFDDEFDKNNLRINSGLLIYFYYAGNNKFIGVPISGNVIGTQTAEKLVDLLEHYSNGETTYNGYDLYGLLHQFLYITDPKNPRRISEHNSINSLISIVNGNVTIGTEQYNIHTDRQKLISKIASMSNVIDAEQLNKNFNDPNSNVVLKQAYSTFQMNPSIDKIILPNGLIIDRSDFTHANQDGTSGSTWLGYMFRNSLLVTKAVGQSYTQTNIESCDIINNKTVTPVDDTTAVNQSNEQQAERQQTKSSMNNLFKKLFGGITYKQSNVPQSTDKWSKQTEDDVIKFFDEVLGKLAEQGSTLDLVDDTCLSQLGNEYVMGICHSLSIELSKCAPKSAAYHEAFHKIFELLIPENVRDSLYDKYRQRHKNTSDRQIAEAFADMFMTYMSNRRDSDKSKWYKRLHSWFNKIGITLGIFRKIGLSGTHQLYSVFNDVTNGKYRNVEINDKQKARFEKLFGTGLNYTITNSKTNEKIQFETLNNSSDVQDMVRALGFYTAKLFKLDDFNTSGFKLKNGKQLAKALTQDFINAISGVGLASDQITDVQRAFREIFETKEEYQYAENADGFSAPIGKTTTYPKLDALVPKINDYLKEAITSYSGKINEQDVDDEDAKVMNSNIDKFDRPSYEFSKLDSIPDSTKFFFATVPYLTWGEENGNRVMQWDLSKNRFYSPTFMPIEEVYNLVVNEFGKLSTPAQLDSALAEKANKKPMYKYLYDKFHALYNSVYKYNEDGTITVDYDKEAYMIQIVNAIHSMKHTYIFGQSKTQSDGSKHIYIKESSLDRDSRQFSSQWTTFLLSGQVSVFNRNRDKDGNLTFREGMGGKDHADIFGRTASDLSSIRNWITSSNDELILDGVTYNKNVYSDIDDLKTAIIGKLNRIGIIFTKDAFDYMLSDTYGDLGYDGLASMFTDRGVAQINTFIDLLNGFVYTNGVINQTAVNEGYTKNGFVKELGNKQGAYNRITINNMAQGLGGKRYFSISQNNSISTIVDDINTNDKDNPTLHTLCKFGYNVTVENGMPKGSIILSQLLNNKSNALRVFTYLGLKTDHRGDNGTEYKNESEIDDYVTKMAMLQQDILIFPTLADKGTWMCIDGVNIPGMKFQEQIDQYGNKNQVVTNVPQVMWNGVTPYLRPSNEVLNQMIQYAEGERLALCQCMEDLGYANIPGYQKQGRKPIPKEAYIKNYHTPNGVKVNGKFIEIEPNGTRFLSLTNIRKFEVDKDGKQRIVTINLNDPTKSSSELLELANKEFFDKSLEEKQQIMALTLGVQYNLEIEEALKLGIIERQDVSELRDGKQYILPNCMKTSRSLLNLKNVHLDESQIRAVTEQILNQIPGWKNMSIGPAKNARIECCRSLAIAAILSDATTKSIISSQEVQRCFSGHPALFKVQYDYANKRIKDSTFDIQKRIGGMVSTGEDNMTDIPTLSKSYRCAECKDYEVSSTSDVAKLLDKKFKASSMKESFAITAESIIDEQYGEIEYRYRHAVRKYKDEHSKQQLEGMLREKEQEKADVWKAVYMVEDDNIDTINDPEYIATLFKGSLTKQQIDRIHESLNKAASLAQSFSDAYKKDINVADGASFITADMCQDMLRMRGQLTGRVKAAFDLLKSDKQYSWMSIADAYDTIYNAVNIVTTKYTAYGVRDHTLYNNEYHGEVSDVAVTYYNKYALFPLFPCIATGRMSSIYQKMLNEHVDSLFMTSAVKVGSQGAVSFNGETIEKPFNVYTQQYSFLRKQLNTDPEEGEMANLGTQMVKIVLQNLRLLRDNYIDAKDESTHTGKEILSKYMGAINELERLGYKELEDKFFTDGKIDNTKLCDYLQSQLSSRNANKCLLEALQINRNGELNCPIAATSDSSWIESILISTINKNIIKIPTPGNSFVQRSVFAMEDSDIQGGSIQGMSIYNGKKLQMINEDKSMDSVISIDYFDYILPKRKMSFNEKRQWLIDNNIIGDNAKANTIGYRIPTQAQSSIHALRFVDVIPAVKSTIILPEEFTKITGSDFDIDHLYLASLNYQILEDGNIQEIKDGDSKERYQNDILYCMLTMLKDTDNSINSLYKSIDNDTELPKSIADQIPETSSNKSEAYNFGTLHEQAERRLDYVTGKTGIGPFALNVTNHVLTCLFGVKFNDTQFTEQTGIFNFDKLVDKDGNMISSWLSAFINAHVDIVKDPWVSKMGVDKFTYNMVNLLVRSGFGDAGMWFIAQPIIKDMAKASANAQSEFSRDTNKYKSVYSAQRDAVAQAVLQYLDETDVRQSVLDKYEGSDKANVGTRIDAVNYIKNKQDVLKEIATHPGQSKVFVNGTEYDVKEVQKNVFYAWKTLEKYSIALSTLVQYTKIDTSKQGKTFLEMYRYLDMYTRMLTNKNSLWDKNSLYNLVYGSWIDSKTKDACTFPFKAMSTQLFNANPTFINIVLDICNRLKNEEDPLQIDMMNEVSNSLQTAIKSDYIVQYARQELNMTDKDISGLFVGNMCINHRFNMFWNAIRTNPKYARFANNQLLTHLYSVNEENEVWVNGKRHQRPAFLSISDSIEDSRLNSDLMIDAWEDLLMDNDPFVKRFAQDLIVYAALTSGEYKGWNKLFKFVPPAWVRGETESFSKIGSFSDYINGLLSKDQIQDKTGDDYINDIIANHFMDNKFSTRVPMKDKDGNNNFLTCSDIVAIGSGKEVASFPNYITVKKPGTTGRNSSDYVTYYLAYTFKPSDSKKDKYYPVYVRAQRKGYTSQDKKFNIYEYGWHFSYAENEADAFSTFDYTQAIDRLGKYISAYPISTQNISNATNINVLSDRIAKVYLGYVPDQIEDNTSQTEDGSQKLQAVTNVYAGNNENTNLSNFALRPFETRIGKFDTVEGAFQAAKIYYTNGTKYLTRDNTGKITGLTEEGKSIIKRLMSANGSDARSIGRNISDLNVELWNKHSTNLLEDFMRRSFEQNPQAKKELVNTGDSIITHKNKQGVEQDNGRFSNILMRIRDEIKSTFNNANQSELFSKEDMEEAQKIKNHCKGGN